MDALVDECRGRCTEIHCEETPLDIAFIYTLLRHTENPLIIHRELLVSMALVRKLRGWAKILIEDETPLRRIVEHIDEFGVFVVVGYAFNDFEREFLRRACEAKGKTAFHFSRHSGEHTMHCERERCSILGRVFALDSCD